ncbi:SRPBCC family protein [Rhodococcus sp. NPDC056960]|uniref:aromatic ring-hydroxylating oxygenase subunit alpha n=1 Tax=Rhodococcus sp. NPDC056960 TaxID=3345982 RepID=UPI003634A06D
MTAVAGAPRSEGPSAQDYLDRDSKPVPASLRYNRNDQLDSTDLPIERYISPEFARVEMEKMWYRVWQMACVEGDIPEVGDHIVYEIGDRSYIVIRTETGIRAYVNACLHRARLIRERGGNVPELRCTFHGFTWNLDGTMKTLPCAWDFPHVDPADLTLPEAKVDTWRGFVFINPDPDAESLSDFLGNFVDQWIWPIETRYKAVHVAKKLPLNWKAAQEAFMETYHVIATHPQILTWTGDSNSQYDATSDQPHWNRMINVQGVPSPHVADFVDEQDVLESFYAARTFYSADTGRDLQSDGDLPEIPEGSTARAVLAEEMRKQLTKVSGRDYSQYSDSELLDTVQHTVFPNFHPWGGFKSNIVYRWRPNGFDPDSCIFETLIMADPPQGQPVPPSAPVRWVSDDEQFTDVAELGLLGPVFDQDIDNMVWVQRGMKATLKKGLTLAQYQESRIRQMHQTLSTYIEE